MILHCSEAELESYLNRELLPLLGLPTVEAHVRFLPGSAILTIGGAGNSQPLCRLMLSAEDAGAASLPEVKQLILGPLAASPFAARVLERIATTSLQSGELGVYLHSAIFQDGAAYLTLSRR